MIGRLLIEPLATRRYYPEIPGFALSSRIRSRQPLGELGLDGRGRDGLGGWWTVDEPGVHFVLDSEGPVPDAAGWRI